MKTKIWEVADRSKDGDCSLVLYKFMANETYKLDKHGSTEYSIRDRLWVDFKNGKFVFADQPNEAKWEDCSIAGTPYTKAVMLFPCDDDTYMSAISLRGLTPKKFMAGMSARPGGRIHPNWCRPRNATLSFIGYNGGYLTNKEAFLSILEYQDLQGYHKHPMGKKYASMYSEILHTMVKDMEAKETARGESKADLQKIVECRIRYKEFQEDLLNDCGLVVKDFDGKVISNKWDELVK